METIDESIALPVLQKTRSVDQLIRNKNGVFAKTFKKINSKSGQEYIDSFEKALLERCVAFCGCAPAAALILIAAAAIYFNDRGDVFYTQERVGKDAKLFRMWKLRSLYMKKVDRQQEIEIITTHKAHQDPRAFLVGRILRLTDVDELPQLFQILSRKHMSLIGHRALTPEETERVMHMGDNSKLVDVSKGSKFREEWKRKGLQAKPSVLSVHSAIARTKRKQMKHAAWLDQIYSDNASLGLDIYVLWKNFVNRFSPGKEYGQARE